MIIPWLDTIVLWIHILAAITWVGGMIFVAAIVGPYVRITFPPEERAPLMAAIGKRFGVLSWSAILTLVVTGAYNAVRFVGTWDTLLNTTFGHILLVKIALVAVMIGLSVTHDFFLGPRQRDLNAQLRKSQSLVSESSPEQTLDARTLQRLQRLRRWAILVAQLNLALGVVVILLAASLQSY